MKAWVIVSFVCGIAVGFCVYNAMTTSAKPLDNKKSPSVPDGNHSQYDSAEGSASKKSDLSKWNTREGVMEIAHDETLQKVKPDRWATKQGVMEVATESSLESTKPDFDSRYATRQGIIEVAEESPVRDSIREIVESQRRAFKLAESANRRLRKEHESVQVTISNTSTKERPVSLWGTDTPISAPSYEDVEDQQQLKEVVTGVHPQGIVFNPFNSLIYVANQLSDTVSVCTQEGEIVKTINLCQPNSLPGTHSPVDLVVHTITDSPLFGTVYVAGSVSNEVIIISPQLNVIGTIPVDVRPVAIAFNPVNAFLYTVNLVSNSFTAINTTTNVVLYNVATGDEPRAVVVNPENGDVYVANSRSGSVYVYNKFHLMVAVIELSSNPGTLFWHPVLKKIYVTLKDVKKVIVIEPDDYTAPESFTLSHVAQKIEFHGGNQFLYVSNRNDQTVTILRQNNSVRAALSTGDLNIGFIIVPNTYSILWTATRSGKLKLLTMLSESSLVVADRHAIAGQLNDFRSNPPHIKHVKISVSSDKSISRMIIREYSITGKQSDKSISLSSYDSPQHFLKVYDVKDFEGTSIDGFTQWIFSIPAETTVTLLIYYKPYEKRKEMLLNTALQNVNLNKQNNVKTKSS